MNKKMLKIRMWFFFKIVLLSSLVVSCATQTYRDPIFFHESSWDKYKLNIMEDPSSLIAEGFNVDESLKQRVSFWMDIYGRYSSTDKVIHDRRYPWIVYEVIHTDGSKKVSVHRRVRYYTKILKNLRKKNLSNQMKNLSSKEKEIVQFFEKHPGYIKRAYKNVRFQTGQKNHIQLGLQRSQKYLPYMEKIFVAENMPVELTRLPFVESSFNWSAQSKVGAVGVWQFMTGTGRKFMKINKYIDERISPIKSTKAAARLLKENKKIFQGNWSFAVTAYNHGPGGVKKAIKKMGIKDLGIISDRYKSRRFSFASANFYSSFLAVLYLQKYGQNVYSPVPKDKPLEFLAHKTKHRIRAQRLLRKVGLSASEFIKWNPDLKKAVKRNSIIPKNFVYYRAQVLT